MLEKLVGSRISWLRGDSNKGLSYKDPSFFTGTTISVIRSVTQMSWNLCDVVPGPLVEVNSYPNSPFFVQGLQ